MNTQAGSAGPNRIDGLVLAGAVTVFGMIIVDYVDTMPPNHTGAEERAWLRWLPEVARACKTCGKSRETRQAREHNQMQTAENAPIDISATEGRWVKTSSI